MSGRVSCLAHGDYNKQPNFTKLLSRNASAVVQVRRMTPHQGERLVLAGTVAQSALDLAGDGVYCLPIVIPLRGSGLGFRGVSHQQGDKCVRYEGQISTEPRKCVISGGGGESRVSDHAGNRPRRHPDLSTSPAASTLRAFLLALAFLVTGVACHALDWHFLPTGPEPCPELARLTPANITVKRVRWRPIFDKLPSPLKAPWTHPIF